MVLLVLPQGLSACIPTSSSNDSRSPQTIPRAAESTNAQNPRDKPATAPDPSSESPAPPGPGQSYDDAVRRGLVNDEYAVQVAGSSVRKGGDDRSVTLQFTVTNAGKRDDGYRVEVLPTGAQLLAAPAETLYLAAGTSTTIAVEVRLLPEATEPSVLFRASSRGNSSVIDETTVTQF